MGARPLTNLPPSSVLGNRTQEHFSMESTINIAELLARLEALTIENAKLRIERDDALSAARIDVGTDLFNKRHFDQMLNAEFSRLARGQSGPLSLLMIDLDHFKRINDEHGHIAGDKVLAKVAKIIRENVRENDIVCRFGGEEIVVIMPAAETKDATVCAERLRAAIASARQSVDGLKVTASIGVATAKTFDVPLDLVDAADKAVYAAKGAGRNCVRTATAA